LDQHAVFTIKFRPHFQRGRFRRLSPVRINPKPCGEALRRMVVIRYCGADGTDAGLLNDPIEDRSRCLSGVSLPPSVLDQTPSNLHVTIGARRPLQVDRSHDSVGTPFDDDTDALRKLVAIGPQRPTMP